MKHSEVRRIDPKDYVPQRSTKMKPPFVSYPSGGVWIAEVPGMEDNMLATGDTREEAEARLVELLLG